MFIRFQIMLTNQFLFLIFDYQLYLHSPWNHSKLQEQCIENLLALTIHFKKHWQPPHFSHLLNPILYRSSLLNHSSFFPDPNFHIDSLLNHFTILHLLGLHQYLAALFAFFSFLKGSASSFSPLAWRELAYFLQFWLGKSDYLVKMPFIVSSLKKRAGLFMSQNLRAWLDSLALCATFL
jgi:hypothetical protein